MKTYKERVFKAGLEAEDYARGSYLKRNCDIYVPFKVVEAQVQEIMNCLDELSTKFNEQKN